MTPDAAIPPANPDILLDAVRVRVEFGPLIAVNNLSLQLAPGTLLGLIGPNGAGKTTLLRALAGMQPMAAGLVRVMGEKATRANARLWAVVGFTGDNPPAYEGLSVRDYLRFIARSYHLSPADADERIALWLDKVWLTEKADQKVKALSRGMRQRLGIARTLLPNPHVVLLDEPAAGLDPAGRVQFRQLLCSLRDMGKALIVSSHILADLNEYCTHIGIMAHGQMVQYGTVAEVAAAGDGQRCRYTLSLARAVPEIAELLAGVEHLGQVSLDREQVSFEYRSDKEAAAGLLAMLVREGIPVAGFTAHRPDLEQAYLRAGIRQVD